MFLIINYLHIFFIFNVGDLTIFIIVIFFKPPFTLYHFEELKLLYHCITFSSFVGHIFFKVQ